MTIRELDDATVRQIAAGEVIERPASAVKELVENSLDADASRIDVAVERGGKDRIRVADDGVGMTESEVRTAVREHTTSKIEEAADLQSIATLGFRGEALYAIGAVSTTTITTRSRGGDRATELRVEHGEVASVEPAGRPEGTTVDVRDLFAEMPARRKFLKADATEFDHVNRIVSRYALANPDVAISLSHDGRETFATTGDGDLQSALLSVYGREVAESMVEVDGDGVRGYVSHPETTRSTREYVSTYVNGRYVADATLRNAILDAYGDQLAPDRYPFAVVFVEVPPGDVDANVHPRKLQVRFENEDGVRERVRSEVRSALLSEGIVRSGAPRGRSAPDDVDVSPGEGASGSPALSTWDESRSGSGDDSTTSAVSDGHHSTGGGEAQASEPGPDDSESGRLGPSDTTSVGRASRDTTTGDSATASAPARREAPDRRFRGIPTQTSLEGDAVEDPSFERLPAMRVLGQLHDTYVVAETDEGLVLIDQHAADERVNYERLCERVVDDPSAQALAEPVSLELTAREASLLPAFTDALEAVGFRTDAVDDRTVEVDAVPAVLGDAADPALLRDLIGEFADGRAESVEERADALLADLACHPAVTGNTSLTDGSVRALLEALEDCENPYACPHGRPTIVEIDADELAARFERDYPGHAGRRSE